MNAPPDEANAEIDRLIEGYLDGALNDEDEASLGRLVAESVMDYSRTPRR